MIINKKKRVWACDICLEELQPLDAVHIGKLSGEEDSREFIDPEFNLGCRAIVKGSILTHYSCLYHRLYTILGMPITTIEFSSSPEEAECNEVACKETLPHRHLSNEQL